MTFIVQRYGADVIGGAEHLCRGTAEALRDRGYRVVVHTTTAREYLHWQPAFAAGHSELDGIAVHRYDALPADPGTAARLSKALALGGGSWDDQAAWARAQGPVCPGLLEAIAADSTTTPVVMWTYLYATTQLVSPLVRGRGIVVPTAHNEPELRFGVTRGVMNLAAGFALLTPEERALVDDLFGIGGRPAVVVGAALVPDGGPVAAPSARAVPYVLYVGRMDPGKGVSALLDDHGHYRALGGTAELVFAGPGAPPPGLPPWAHHLGRVSTEHRAALLSGAVALAMPSVNESYSLVLAEAWQAGTPTLATARGAVVAGQTARSGGGLIYCDGTEYATQLERLQRDAGLAERLGAAGRAWATTQTWDAVADRWEELLQRVAASAG